MIAEILSVGTELLLGQIVNSDAQYLSRRLSELGITVYHHTTVGDNPDRVREALRQALGRSDLVITTGGLGPTEDDLTKEMVALELGLTMRLHQPSMDALEDYFQRFGRKMTENNKKQAYFPEGAQVLPNEKGTAPGCVVEKDGKMVAVLPGPPRELTAMYDGQLEPFLRARTHKRIASRFLRIFGVGESEVETRLKDLFSGSNPTLALYCATGEVTARITVMCEENEDPAPLMEPLEAEIRARLGDSVYGEGLKESLANVVLQKLLARGATVALAESCTGGMIASRLVDCPGASEALVEGHVTYSNQAKMRILGVTERTLAQFGAVSAQCAAEMAAGARGISGADYALSVTGIAGPGGGTPEKPVGLVYIGLASRQGVETWRFLFNGDRGRVRELSCLNALDKLRRALI
jgi:nicotinamide-nucleotide amidase